MKHPRLLSAIKSVEDSGLILQRLHGKYGETQIRILDAWHDWDVLSDRWFVTGDTDKQCEEIEKIVNQYKMWS